MKHVAYPIGMSSPNTTRNAAALRRAGILAAAVLLLAGLFPGTGHAVSLSVIEDAAQSGDRGLRVLIDEAKPGYLQDDSPEALKQYRARFYIRVDALEMPAGENISVCVAYSTTDLPVLYLRVKQVADAIRLGAAARLSSGSYTAVPDRGEVRLDPGWHAIELQWLAAKDFLNANGALNLWVDGRSVTGLTGLSNSTLQVQSVRLGAVEGVTAAMSGWFDLDEFVSRAKGYIGATPTTTGISDVSVAVNAPNTVIPLFPAFADAETADSALAFTVIENTNPDMFDAITIDAATGALTLDYAADALGKAELTIRATDQDGLYVDTAFRVTLHTVNTPPTTTGIANVSVKETAPNTVIALFPVFGDAETADNALVLTVAGNTNPALFDAVTIGAATGALTLDYAAGAFGAAQITIRATDGEGLYVESTFTVTVAEVTSDVNNDGIINAVDVQLVINAALGLPVEGEPDIDGSGKVNAVDVQLVINGVLGI